MRRPQTLAIAVGVRNGGNFCRCTGIIWQDSGRSCKLPKRKHRHVTWQTGKLQIEGTVDLLVSALHTLKPLLKTWLILNQTN